MAASVGLSAIRKVLAAEAYLVHSGSLQEGAVVVFSGSGDAQNVQAPAGAAAKRVAGVIMDQQPSAGTTSGDVVNVQTLGIGLGLLVAGGTAAEGDPLIVANSSGHLKVWTNETDVDVVGYSLANMTAGSNADAIPFRLNIHRKT